MIVRPFSVAFFSSIVFAFRSEQYLARVAAALSLSSLLLVLCIEDSAEQTFLKIVELWIESVPLFPRLEIQSAHHFLEEKSI
jgi:hypothetical protein